MIYRGMKLKAQDYFDETETYLNRCFGNAIEPYDVMNGFARVGLTESTKIMLKGYKPSGYVSDVLNTQETAMLGYLAMGMPEATGREKWNYNDSYDDFEELEDDEKEKIQKYENAANELEDNYRRQLCVSRLFQASTDVDIEPLTGAHYVQIKTEMENAYKYTAEAVKLDDYETIAKICEQGLYHLRNGVDTYLNADILDLYADCYVCDGILKLIEKNEQIREKVNIPEEQMTYYQGLRKLKTIMENGEKAKEQLESPESLSENERTKLNEYVKQYTDLQIMMKLNYVNEAERGDKKLRDLQNVEYEFRLVTDLNLGKKLEYTSYQVEANPFVKQLGGMEPDEFLNDISKQADQIRQTGTSSRFEKLEDVGEEFQNVEKKIKQSEQSTEILENSEKLRKEQQLAEKTRSEGIKKLEEEEKLSWIGRDVHEYTRTEKEKYTGQLFDVINERSFNLVWKEANKWKIDNFLQGSSDEFKAVRDTIKKMKEFQRSNGIHETEENAKAFRKLVDELNENAKKYLDKKDGGNRREQTERNSYANRRYEFVRGLEKYAQKFIEKQEPIEQRLRERPLIGAIADAMLRRPEFESYRKAENIALVHKSVEVLLNNHPQIDMEKLLEAYEENKFKTDEFADKFGEAAKRQIGVSLDKINLGNKSMKTALQELDEIVIPAARRLKEFSKKEMVQTSRSQEVSEKKKEDGKQMGK